MKKVRAGWMLASKKSRNFLFLISGMLTNILAFNNLGLKRVYGIKYTVIWNLYGNKFSN